jgi:hypothetical protein
MRQSPVSTDTNGCGCYYIPELELSEQIDYDPSVRSTVNRLKAMWLPQLRLEVYTTIVSTTSRTVLKQTFKNGSANIKEAVYSFPIYDGVSIVSFNCRIGDRVLKGVVKEKEEARAIYNEAVEKGQKASLLVQLPQAADVFQSRIGRVDADQDIEIEIVYLGELKHDAEVDGIRWTLPSTIGERYGSSPQFNFDKWLCSQYGELAVTVDIVLDKNQSVRGIESTSHIIATTFGATSRNPGSDFRPFEASVTLSGQLTEKGKDFVLLVLADNLAAPQALLEQHSTLRNQRALMVSFLPQFKLKPSKPEIVFIIDRSGSMSGGNIETLKSALQILIKSLPAGVKFNICSFGSMYSFLWDSSRLYSAANVKTALSHVQDIQADMGGTEMMDPIKAVINKRCKTSPLDMIIITDGQIWNQQVFFDMINDSVTKADRPLRLFGLGIGNDASSALVEGAARAGRGFAQSVMLNEHFNSKVMKLLKGALSPHLKDYSLEVTYRDDGEEEDFEIIESLTESMSGLLKRSFINPNEPNDPNAMNIDSVDANINKATQTLQERLHTKFPKLLQAPSEVTGFYDSSRVYLYILMSPKACLKTPRSVIISATSYEGPIRQEIPITILETPSKTIHQLAAKKAMLEIEEGRGWIMEARDDNGVLLRDRMGASVEKYRELEAARLGIKFQIMGRYCSFVAVDLTDAEDKMRTDTAIEHDTSAEWDEDESDEDDLEENKVGSRYATRPNGFFNGLFNNLFNQFPSPISQPSSGSGRGLLGGKGGAMRHRKIMTGSGSSVEHRGVGGSRTKQTARKQLSSKAARKGTAAPSYPGAVKTKPKALPKKVQTPLETLVDLQEFDGYWEIKEKLLKLLKVKKGELKTFIEKEGLVPRRASSKVAEAGHWELAERAIMTVLVIAYFENHLKSERDVWELVVEKAKAWLKGILNKPMLKKVERAERLLEEETA